MGAENPDQTGGADEGLLFPEESARAPSAPGFAEAKAAPTPAPTHLGHRERLRQRFLAGPSAMPDYEVLQMLLFGARPRVDTKPWAKALIQRFGSLAGVLGAAPQRLRDVEGAEGDTVVATLKLVQEAALRFARAEAMQRSVIGSWQALLDYCQIALGQSSIEQFRILFLNRKNMLIADELQQEGTIDHTPVYPREVVKRALELGASSIILVHNHPSGDPTPSKADIEMTRQVRDAGKALGISLHDHLVIARGRHASFKSMGLL